MSAEDVNLTPESSQVREFFFFFSLVTLNTYKQTKIRGAKSGIQGMQLH